MAALPNGTFGNERKQAAGSDQSPNFEQLKILGQLSKGALVTLVASCICGSQMSASNNASMVSLTGRLFSLLVILLGALLTAVVYTTNEMIRSAASCQKMSQQTSCQKMSQQTQQDTPQAKNVSVAYDNLEDEVEDAPPKSAKLCRMQSHPQLRNQPAFDTDLGLPVTRGRSTTDPHLRQMASEMVFEDSEDESDDLVEDDDDEEDADSTGGAGGAGDAGVGSGQLAGGRIVMKGKLQKRSKMKGVTIPRQWHWRYFVLTTDGGGGGDRSVELKYYRSAKTTKLIASFDLSSPNCFAFVSDTGRQRGGKKGSEIVLMCQMNRGGEPLTLRAPSAEEAMEWVAKVQSVAGGGSETRGAVVSVASALRYLHILHCATCIYCTALLAYTALRHLHILHCSASHSTQPTLDQH
jgi:hypothetical protein